MTITGRAQAPDFSRGENQIEILGKLFFCFFRILEKLAEIEKKTARGDSRETIIEAVQEMKSMLETKWLMGSGRVGRGFMMPPPALNELNEILAILKDEKSTALDIYRAQKRFEKIVSTE